MWCVWLQTQVQTYKDIYLDELINQDKSLSDLNLIHLVF